MDIELSLLDKLKARVQLARQIELSHHKVKKANHEKNWMRETAKAMDIELDSDFVRCLRSWIATDVGLNFLTATLMEKSTCQNRSGKRRIQRLLG